jgi:hypothetical protein
MDIAMRVFETHKDLQAAFDLAPLMSGAYRFAKQYGDAGFRCSQCGEAKPFPLNGGGTGYGLTKDNAFTCYACCGENDRRNMIETGKAFLYLTHPVIKNRQYTFADGKITNWPGTLSMPCRVKRGAHNIARYRYDAWFTGPDGKPWHGVQYGDNSQIIRCKRLKTV